MKCDLSAENFGRRFHSYTWVDASVVIVFAIERNVCIYHVTDADSLWLHLRVENQTYVDASDMHMQDSKYRCW